MAEKYKFLQDVSGVEYGQLVKNNVSYKTGDVVYGIASIESNSVYVNSTGIFDNVSPTLAVSQSIVEKTNDDVNVTPSDVTTPISQETDSDITKASFWDSPVTLQKKQLYGLVIFSAIVGYFIGTIVYKKK